MASAFPMLVKCFQQQWNGLSDWERDMPTLDPLGAAGLPRLEERDVHLWVVLFEFRDKKTKRLIGEKQLDVLTIKFDPEPRHVLRFLDNRR